MKTREILLSRVRLVRRRWRTQAAVKGLALFLVASTAVVVLGIWGADLYGFRPAAVWLVRVVTGAAAVAVFALFLFLPLRRRVTDLQIARFIEERYRGLEDRLVAAIEFGGSDRASEGLIDLQIRDAIEKTSRLDLSVFLDRRRVALFGSVGLAALLVLFAILNWGPAFFPYGFGRLYAPWVKAAGGASMAIEVTPQGAEVAKGADLPIKASLRGFDSSDVKLFVRNEGASVWTPLAMEPEARGSRFGYLFVEVQSSAEYYVEAAGVRSPGYMLRVLDVPRVERIDAVYNFPAYTGMQPQQADDEGDLVAMRGTRVDLKVKSSVATPSARLRMGDGSAVELRSSGTKEYSGSLTLSKSGTYVVELESAGKPVAGSREYVIEVTDDAPPSIQISRPMRDVRATNVEEVFAELKAEDDVGVGQVELRYSVNGGAEKAIPLFKGKAAESPVTASHTFFLEEFGLQPGDVISYYGRATDNNNVSGPGVSSSDIYFIEVRPFEQKYTQSQQGGGQAGAGGGEGQEALSRQQKEIISATFKLIRDHDTMDPGEYSEALKSLALVQSRLQSQAQNVVDRMRRRGASAADPRFAKISEYLAGAVGEMEAAAVQLGAQNPKDALPSEQKALQQLMRAESLFIEVQISFGNQGSGGQGGSRANAEDLADLFELELNKLKNQYETVQRGEQAARDQKVDEALERLRELARRQQQQNERNRLAGQRGGSQASGGGGSGGQQQIADEAEQLRRQLQRLSRERSSPELNRASNQLQKAIEEMKRSLNRGSNQAESSAGGIRALQQLDEAQRALSHSRDAGLEQGMEQAAGESARLLEEQNRIQESLGKLAQDKGNEDTPENRQRRQDLTERKSVLADRVRNLGQRVDDLARQARKTQQESSSRLSEAAGTIRDRKLPERIMNGNSLIEGGYYDIAKGREEYVRSGLDEVNRQVEAARSSLGQTREGRLENSLNRTRQLAEGLESLRRRLQQSRSGSQSGESGRQGRRPGEGEQSAQQQGREGQAGGEGDQPGQGQQQSAQGRGDRPGGENRGGQARDAAAGATSPESEPQGLTGNASAPPLGGGRYSSDEDYRQLRRDAQQRLMDAQSLRSLYDRNTVNQQNLDQVIESLRRVESTRDYGAAEQIARLKAAIDLMRQIETDLGRDLATLARKDRYFYADDGEAPQRYRKLVEEYYRALARR